MILSTAFLLAGLAAAEPAEPAKCRCDVGYSTYEKSWYYEVYCTGENDGSEIAEGFSSEAEAKEAMSKHPVCRAWGFADFAKRLDAFKASW